MELKELTLLSGVSGNENQVREAIFKACVPICDKVYYDKMGNVIAQRISKIKDAPHIIFAAHMDEVGLIITSATEEGFLRVQPVGGIDPRVIISKRVLVGEKAVPGVIGSLAIHLQSAEDRQRVMGYDSIYIDIGAKTKSEALEDCPQGSYVTFDTPYTPFGDGYVCAKALDDRVGCYAMLDILKNSYDYNLTCLFTNQEEIGCRGAIGGAYGVQGDMAIILEGTTCNDLGDVPESQKVCVAGDGVAISFMDNSSIAHLNLFKSIVNLAKSKNIAHQIKQSVSGGNEGGAFQRSKSGMPTCVLSIPCRYIHSPSSVVKLSDIQAQIQLSKAILQSDLPKNIINN